MNESLFYKMKKKIIKFFADIKIYPYPGFFMLWGDTSYKVKGPRMREVLDIIQPGDILVRMYNNYIGSFFIPGYWTHAAIFEGPNNIIHMLGAGINREDILTFMRCDDIGILRHKGGIEVAQEAIELARTQLEKGTKYDFDFNTENSETFYCTELIDYCYNLGYPKDKILIPDQLIFNPDLEVILPREKR